MENQLLRSVVKVEGEDIVVEVFKDATGKVVRQQSFSLSQLQTTKSQLAVQYQNGITRIDEMIGLLTS